MNNIIFGYTFEQKYCTAKKSGKWMLHFPRDHLTGIKDDVIHSPRLQVVYIKSVPN